MVNQFSRRDKQPLPNFNSLEVKSLLPASQGEQTEQRADAEERAIIHSSGKPKLLPKIEWSDHSKLGQMLQEDSHTLQLRQQLP